MPIDDTEGEGEGRGEREKSRLKCPAYELARRKNWGLELEETEKGNALTFGDEKGMFHVAASCQAVEVG